MNPDDIVAAFQAHAEARDHLSWIKQQLRSAISLELTSPDGPSLSQVGGVPLVPSDFEWPKAKVGEYRFLAQIDFSEVADESGQLPDAGLLSLFYNYDEDGEVFWGDPGYVVGYFYPDPSVLVRNSGPCPSEQPRFSLRYGQTTTFPMHEDLVAEWPFDPDVLYEVEGQIHVPSNYMLGHPHFCTLAYDPTPGPGWIQLLNLESRDDTEWFWHDGDRLMVFVEASKIKGGDFSDLRSDAG